LEQEQVHYRKTPKSIAREMASSQQAPVLQALTSLTETWTAMNTADPSWTPETTFRSILTEEEVDEFLSTYSVDEPCAEIAKAMLDCHTSEFMEISTKFERGGLGVGRPPERHAVGEAMDLKASKFSFYCLRLMSEDQVCDLDARLADRHPVTEDEIREFDARLNAEVEDKHSISNEIHY
jgi:hypothetical protein